MRTFIWVGLIIIAHAIDKTVIDQIPGFISIMTVAAIIFDVLDLTKK